MLGLSVWIKNKLQKKLRLKIIFMAIVPMIVFQIAIGGVAFWAYRTITVDLVMQRDRELVNLTTERLKAFLDQNAEQVERLAGASSGLQQAPAREPPLLPEGAPQGSLGAIPVPPSGSSNAFGSPNTTGEPYPAPAAGFSPFQPGARQNGPQQNGRDSALVILDSAGVITSASSQPGLVGQDWSQRTYYQQVTQTRQPSYSALLPGKSQAGEIIVGAFPLFDEQGELAQVAVQFLPFDGSAGSLFYEKLTQVLPVEPGRTIYLLDGQGTVIYHTDSRYVGQDFSALPFAQPVLRGEARTLHTQNIAGMDTITGFAPIAGTDWKLVIEGDWSAVMQQGWIYPAILLFLLSLGVVVPAALIATGIRRITDPIEALTTATQQVATGDFNQTIAVHTGDEIETLATQFNQMAARLCESYSGLEQKVHRRTAELAAANERYRAVSELTSDYIYQVTIREDGDFILDWATDTVEPITGYTPAELAGKGSWLSLIHIDDLPAYQEQRVQLFRSETPQAGPIVFEYRLLAKNGAVHWLRDYWRPVWDMERGRATRILGATQDITPQKQAEEALRQAMGQAQHLAEAAEAANRAKSVFLANMSHELRTPLNAILGYAQLMQRDNQVTAQQCEFLETIGRSGEHLLGLINDVLTMSKVEAGRATLLESSFDLHRQLAGLEEMFRLRATEKGLQLILDIAPAVPQYVYADEGRLRQVLMNLLSNAIKFTHQGGVTLRGGLPGALTGTNASAASPLPEASMRLCFEVEDSGVGISAAEMDLLFEPFGQTASGKSAHEGTGLGLPISQQYVCLMGGDLLASSTPGLGSCFRFEIPVRPAAPGELETTRSAVRRRVVEVEMGDGADQSGEPPAGQAPPYRLLVVEDQATNRDLLVKLLTSFGFDVRCAANGQEGIQLWERWQPHLVWMDMRMPVLNGYEATRQLKARARAAGCMVAIVALTASAVEEDRQVILEAGCDAFVRKPFREDEIFETLAQQLGVRLVYEEIDAPPTGRKGGFGSDEAVLQALRGLTGRLPAGWAADLHGAVTRLDAEQMGEYIEMVRPLEPRLADQLQYWVQQFAYEKILHLLAQLLLVEAGV